MRSAIPLLLLLALLGCGQKGPLYLPDEPPATQEPADEEDPDRDAQRTDG